MDVNVSTAWTALLIFVVVWDLTWKGFALWRASRNDQPVWFVVLLVLNTAGILSIIYILTHLERPSLDKEVNHEKVIPIRG